MIETPVTEITTVTASAVIGAVVFKVFEKFLNGERLVDEQAAFRKELRDELDAVRRDVVSLEADVTKWRDMYYEQKEINARLEVEIIALRRELDEYRTQIKHIDLLPDEFGN